MTKDKFNKLKDFLIKHADAIQQEATNQHKKYLGTKSLRNEYIEKYKASHALIVKELANHLDTDLKKAPYSLKSWGKNLPSNLL